MHNLTLFLTQSKRDSAVLFLIVPLLLRQISTYPLGALSNTTFDTILYIYIKETLRCLFFKTINLLSRQISLPYTNMSP